MDTDRNPTNGRFVSGNRAGVGHGRPPRAKEQEMLDAIRDTFSADELQSVLREALAIARQTQSARGLLAVVEFCADRALGRPAVTITSKPTDRFEVLLAQLGSNDRPAPDTDEEG